MTERKFQFYVVGIPNEFTILVNGGEEYNDYIYEKNLDGIEPILSIGSKLEVIIPGYEIKHPITGESLGYYDFVKETLEVTKLHYKFFECAKISKQKNGLVNALSPMLGPSNPVYDSIEIDESQVMHKPNITKQITIGDPVIFLD